MSGLLPNLGHYYIPYPSEQVSSSPHKVTKPPSRMGPPSDQVPGHTTEILQSYILSPVSKDASVGGTYQGVESMGLLWGMVPVPGSRTGLR